MTPAPRIRRGVPPAPIPRQVARLRIVRRLPTGGKGFLTLSRFLLRNEYEDGSISRPYRFEMVERRGVDSVAVIPFLRDARRIWVVVKAGFRPALYLRGIRESPAGQTSSNRLTVEAVAGSLEPGDSSSADVDRRAVLELYEETGYRVGMKRLITLGAGFFPSHGQCTEKIHLRAVDLKGRRPARAPGDGSVNEAETQTLLLEAQDLLSRCRRGEIQDPKLEIGAQRLLGLLRDR